MKLKYCRFKKYKTLTTKNNNEYNDKTKRLA